MNTAIMPMPGALRWRALHPLIDGDGACTLLYDQERAAVLEVPEELQLHVASALETGDPDDALLSWLVAEDLITMDGRTGLAPESWLGVPMDEWGAVLRLEGEAHIRITEAAEEAALRAVEVGFRQGLGASRVQLHLDWNGTFPRAGALERIVLAARRLALEAGQEVAFDLTLGAGQVTPAIAIFLSALPVHVRLLCGDFPGGEASLPNEVRQALMILWMEDLPDRVTLCFNLSGEVRLREVWAWARRLGVRHLDVAHRPVPCGTAAPADWLRDLRADLLEVVLEISACLEDRSVPVDFRPLTRVVRRLMHAEPLARFHEDRLGDWPVGEVALPRTEPVFSKPLLGAAGESDEMETECAGCWARHLCRNSSLLVHGDAAQERTAVACAAWRAEAEAALRLYHRLAQADPLQVLRVFGESSGLPDDLPTARVTEPWTSKAPC
ncbi:MAG TPA: hypothetical protein VH394_09035 [Thermoanaerobaculia bacterium]|jgi:hypothetical protein|nr:hypothetical protein [Thermoanaerobaculia bacterium]